MKRNVHAPADPARYYLTMQTSTVNTAARSPRPQPARPGPARSSRRRKFRVFLVFNAAVVGAVAVATVANPYADAGTAAYVATLSLVCTAPLPFIRSYRGRGSLLVMFLAYYFASFGLGDLVRLLSFQPPGAVPIASPTGGSIAILLGAVFFLGGYLVSYGFPGARTSGWQARDWSPRAAAWTGILSWAIGFLSNAVFLFGAADPNSGIHINPLIGGYLALTRFLQPVGSLLLIYLYLTTRNRKVFALLAVTMVLDAGLGFFGGSKQIAMRAPILLLLSIALIRERIPLVPLVVFVMMSGLFFNAFQNYRNQLYRVGESRSTAFERMGSAHEKLSDGNLSWSEQLSDGLDYFIARISQKPIIDIVVARTGHHGIHFQDGATLLPLLYVFVPRILAPDKPNNVTGLLFNHTFGLATANTFIAVTNLGDLYWNFGWAGIVLGMTAIGALMAWAANKFRLDTSITIPKFLFLIVTIYFLILRFESGVALTYTLWARVAVALLLIHAFIPKAMGRLRSTAFRRGSQGEDASTLTSGDSTLRHRSVR